MNAADIEDLALTNITNQRETVRKLVALRKERGLSVDEISARMGVHPDEVDEFERYDSDPTLTDVSRYALAVEARLLTTVSEFS